MYSEYIDNDNTIKGLKNPWVLLAYHVQVIKKYA